MSPGAFLLNSAALILAFGSIVVTLDVFLFGLGPKGSLELVIILYGALLLFFAGVLYPIAVIISSRMNNTKNIYLIQIIYATLVCLTAYFAPVAYIYISQ